jgi:hypothetical protein
MLIGLAVCSAGISNAAESMPSDWHTYENRTLGITLRHPPSMTVHTGEDAAFQGFIPWKPRPDLRMALPESAFEGTLVSEAVVVIYAPWSGKCPPYTSVKPDTQILSNQPFYHWTSGEGAGGHTISAEDFCTMYRGEPFTISAVIQTYRDDENKTEGFVKRAEAGQRDITALLMRVLKTLILTDPASSAKEQ